MTSPPAAAPAVVDADDEQRRRIVSAASQVFREHGLAGARTRQIADAAGVTQTMLFRYFKTKEDIFSAAVFEPLEELIAQILIDIDRLDDADEVARGRTYRAEMERQLRLTTDLTPLLAVGLFSDPDLGRRFYSERLWPLFQRWAGATAAGLRGGPNSDLDPLVVILTIWGMSYGLAVDAMVKGTDVDVKKQAKWLGNLLFYGMANQGKRRR